MKQRTEQNTDKAEKSPPGRVEESRTEDKSEPAAQEPSVREVATVPSSPKPKRSLCWSKTIEIIRLEEAHPHSSFSLHQHFTSRPRIIRAKKDEPMVRDKEEISNENSKKDQE